MRFEKKCICHNTYFVREYYTQCHDQFHRNAVGGMGGGGGLDRMAGWLVVGHTFREVEGGGEDYATTDDMSVPLRCKVHSGIKGKSKALRHRCWQ